MHQPTLRVIKILNALKENKNGLTIAQIAKECGINQATLYPILRTLHKENYVNYDNKTYVISNLISQDAKYENIIKVIIFYMDKLAKHLKLGVQLGVLSGKNVVYLHKCEGAERIILLTKAGDIASANTSALGKALLIDKSKKDLKQIFKKETLDIKTTKTISNVDDLYENICKYKAFDYTHEYGEYDDNFTCYATPIRKNGEVFAAISVSTLTFLLDTNEKDRITKALLEYKKIIEDEID